MARFYDYHRNRWYWWMVYLKLASFKATPDDYKLAQEALMESLKYENEIEKALIDKGMKIDVKNDTIKEGV